MSYRPQDWNELVITVKREVARWVCNGEVLETSFEITDVAPIGLEDIRDQMVYCRIRSKGLQ